MERPFLNESGAARINRFRERGERTKQLLGQTEELILFRDPGTGDDWTAVPAQLIRIVWANREDQIRTSEAGGFTASEGELRKIDPFDVRVGDRFTLSSGASGAVTGFPRSIGGITRAAFTLET